MELDGSRELGGQLLIRKTALGVHEETRAQVRLALCQHRKGSLQGRFIEFALHAQEEGFVVPEGSLI